MIKTLHSQCGGEGHGFKSLSGNLRSSVSCGVKSKQNRSLKINKIENIKKKKDHGFGHMADGPVRGLTEGHGAGEAKKKVRLWL